jgi:hypothetical protein
MELCIDLTINMQQVVRVLQQPNECCRSGAAVYGSCSTPTSCGRDRAHSMRLAPAILRLPLRAAAAFPSEHKLERFPTVLAQKDVWAGTQNQAFIKIKYAQS